ncbi:hypothetical protein ACS0TY_027633 [Phlomoides rotata]
MCFVFLYFTFCTFRTIEVHMTFAPNAHLIFFLNCWVIEILMEYIVELNCGYLSCVAWCDAFCHSLPKLIIAKQ